MQELKFLGQPTRYFSDDMKREFTCVCDPQSMDGKTRREVRECEVHGASAHPENWR